ncbi:endophilin-B2-like [Narcine bancroftii]|uniref:endophilin-B2-like n=1 Tax=Narcine bancroftii TaxID=1343680 RepID=UPI00383146F5
MGSGNNEISQRCENFLKFTEETLGQAEKTELDAHLANRLGKAESTKRGTEKIMKQTEVTLNPNPDVQGNGRSSPLSPKRRVNGNGIGKYRKNEKKVELMQSLLDIEDPEQ